MVQSEPVLLGPDNTLFGRRDLSPFIGFYRPFIGIYRFRVAGEKKVFLPPGPKMFQSEPVVGDLSPFIGFHRGFIAFYRVSSGIYRLLSGFIGDLSPFIGLGRPGPGPGARNAGREAGTAAGAGIPAPGRVFLPQGSAPGPEAGNETKMCQSKPVVLGPDNTVFGRMDFTKQILPTLDCFAHPISDLHQDRQLPSAVCHLRPTRSNWRITSPILASVHRAEPRSDCPRMAATFSPPSTLIAVLPGIRFRKSATTYRGPSGWVFLRAWGPARGQENPAGRREFTPLRRELPPPGREFPSPGRVFLPPGRAPGPEAREPGPRALEAPLRTSLQRQFRKAPGSAGSASRSLTHGTCVYQSPDQTQSASSICASWHMSLLTLLE